MKYAQILIMGALLLGACSTTDVGRVMKGDPPPLSGSLEGGPWLVEDVNGGGVIDNARLEISFDPGDQGTSRVSGLSGCNRFSGTWAQTGTSVSFGPLASTRMACAPALMDLEGKFLKTLEAVRRLSFDQTGAATLTSPDGQVIKLRREKP